MEATGYYCRMCLAKDENYEFILMTGNNEHFKIKFEQCFGIFLDPMMTPLICPRCADKLDEVANIHQMVWESYNFFISQASTGSYQNNPIQLDDNPTASSSKSSEQVPGSSSSSSRNRRNHAPSDSEDGDDEGEGTSEKKKSSLMRNGRRVFPCKICKKEFIRGAHRRHHYMAVHPECNRYKCPTCNETFQFRKGLKLHFKKFDHMRCEICKEKFQDYNTFKMHQKKCKRESKDGIIPCHHCNKMFATQEAIKAHLRVALSVAP